MLKGQLPELVDPRKLAVKTAELVGCIAASNLERIAESVLSINSDVNAELFFGKDEQGLLTIKGNAEVTVSQECQRCLEPFESNIYAEICVAIVRSEEDCSRLPRTYDSFVVETDSANLATLIEDELLLALPIVPVHQQQCIQINEEGLSAEDSPSDIENAEEAKAKKNPFSVLAKLKSGDTPNEH